MEIETSERWPALLRDAEAILDHYRLNENATLRVGGGTSLTFFLDHRLSFDLDLFVGDPAPRAGHLQRLMASGLPRSLTSDVRYPGNFVKLVWHGVGEIDPGANEARLAARQLGVRLGGALAADEDGPAERPARDQPRKLPVVFLVVRSVRDRQKHDLGRGGRAGIDEV